MTSLDEILAQAEDPAFRRVSTARILLRQDLAAAHAALEAELDAALKADARRNREALAPGIARQLEALEDEITTAQVEFRFGSIGRRAWADLIAKHPPTKQQLQHDARLDHNPETFPIAAIAAASVDPVMSVDDVARLEKALNHTQFDRLWAAVIDANINGLALPKSVAAGTILRASGRSATTAAPVESPDPSSWDGL